MLRINHQACNLCGVCVNACPFGAVTAREQKIQTNKQCVLCGTCLSACPQAARTIERRKMPPKELAGYKGILVWIECKNSCEKLHPRRIARELLTCGRKLADQVKEPLTAVVLGDDRLTGLEELCHLGADRVIRCRHELLGDYSTDGFASVFSMITAIEKPAIILFGSTSNGRDLAPRVAARLRFGLTADCTGLDIDNQGRLLCTKPAFGGKVMATIIAPDTKPQAASVRPNTFPVGKPDPTRPSIISDFSVNLTEGTIRTKLVETIPAPANEDKIDQARIVVAAGRGCGKASNLKWVRRLAGALGGVMAGSRSIVELGWIPATSQVGQSGITVAPELYMAIGISGAFHHVVGMNSSKKIIAINKDPDAMIFKYADLCVVGDATEILPRLLEELRK
ncbi:MAG: electron transfer flavoprotein subunit alpha [Desulfobacteraceae bacterium]